MMVIVMKMMVMIMMVMMMMVMLTMMLMISGGECDDGDNITYDNGQDSDYHITEW